MTSVFTFVDDAEYWYNVALMYHQLIVLSDADRVGLKMNIGNPAGRPLGVWHERADTDLTIYRHNHITDRMWQEMGFIDRKKWVDDMVRRTGKSVVS